ncbi:MAG: MaoC family dehydratase N-terminal domain-containing protein [Betaproteobacteria bacterium]
MDVSALQAWIGRSEQAEDEVTLPAARRMAALLDLTSFECKRGDALPGDWYVLLFTPTERQSGLSIDGHPAKGGLLPPVPLPRRMFAGRRVEFRGELFIGDEVSRVSRIERIEAKTGRSGEMCFVTVRHEISSPRGLAVVEEQDIVYREERSTAAAGRDPAPTETASPGTVPAMPWSRTFTPDPTLLFRYSALTFNAHRIHYDTAYARDTEAYPDLLVNGGLTTLLLWQLAKQHTGREIRLSATRNVRPLYVNRPLTLCGGPSVPGQGGKLLLRALDAAGLPAIEAELHMAGA